MPKIRAIIQARMGSSRLRGKSLIPVAGVPLLYYIIGHAQALQFIDEVMVATSSLLEDDPIAIVAEAKGVLTYRGSPKDLLDRFVQSSVDMGDNDIIVRLTADNPFHFYEISNMAFLSHQSSGADYTCIDGLSHTVCEIISLRALRQVHLQHDLDDFDREHVTPYIRRNSSQFKVNSLPVNFQGIQKVHDDLLTVDTWADLVRVENILDILQSNNSDLQMKDVYEHIKSL